jgi:hypothetical protein
MPTPSISRGLNSSATHPRHRFHECITMPPRQFRVASGIGNTKLYELLRDGEIQSVRIGRRRLIVVQSYLDLLDRLTKGAAP